jgi:hypothetical protein
MVQSINFIPVNFLGKLCATAKQEDQKQNRNWYPRKPKQDISCRTWLQRGVLAMNRCNRFRGLLPTFKTAEAVRNVYLHSLHPAKAGC